MKMVSFIVSFGEFLMMSRSNRPTRPNFDQDKTRYVIPKYQREYKWDEEKVVTFFTDIKVRDKFLGNIIINKVSDYYEIVDGQQRITTVILILIALFNKMRSNHVLGTNEEQKEILKYIKNNSTYILENETIGNYLKEIDDTIEILIDPSTDIYYQKSTFEQLYEIICRELENVSDLNSFRKKVLDCQVLVLIGESEGLQNDSIEEIFLDINFKSKLLDVADIFKGYCFKNYFPDNHEELKNQWTEIRKYTKCFEQFGYKDTKDTSEYLYHYLLSLPDSYDITTNLSPRGRHYLEGKSNTETKVLLNDMGEYGKHVVLFSDNLSKDTYAFVDICRDAQNHQTEVHNLLVMRQMCQKILQYTKAQYYKFPFFMCIHQLLQENSLKDNITYDELRKFITTYYVYAFLFINDSKSKNKGSIDHTILNTLYDSQKDFREKIKGILTSVKQLRKKYLNEYKQFHTFGIENAYALYSLIDNYDSRSNFLNQLYAQPSYNQEHLIVHKNSKMNIYWAENDNLFTFSLKELLDEPDGTNNKGINYRRQTSNYLILPEGLNRHLSQCDIVEKISMIKKYYQACTKGIPTHIDIFIQHIEGIATYQTLENIKGERESEEIIKDKYKAFVETYFSDEQQRLLYQKIEAALKEAFRNTVITSTNEIASAVS